MPSELLSEAVRIFTLAGALVSLGIWTTGIVAITGWAFRYDLTFLRGYFETSLERRIYEPVEKRVERSGLQEYNATVVLQVSLALIIGALAITTEILGMAAMTGIAYASYFGMGVTIDLATGYRVVAALSILLAISLVTHSREHVQTEFHHR